MSDFSFIHLYYSFSSSTGILLLPVYFRILALGQLQAWVR